MSGDLGQYSRRSYDISWSSDWSRWPSRPIRSLRYIVTVGIHCRQVYVGESTNTNQTQHFFWWRFFMISLLDAFGTSRVFFSFSCIQYVLYEDSVSIPREAGWHTWSECRPGCEWAGGGRGGGGGRHITVNSQTSQYDQVYLLWCLEQWQLQWQEAIPMSIKKKISKTMTTTMPMPTPYQTFSQKYLEW